MGVLDDAIREHLELKRKHGASEGEIEQQEQEALGAPTRQQPPPADAAADEPVAAAEMPAEPAAAEAEPAPEPAVEEPAEPEPANDAAPEPEMQAIEEAAPEPLPADDGTGVVGSGVEDLPPADDEPDWDFGATRDEPDEQRGGDTPAQGFEPVADEPGGDGEEDVLEETPDFLQETPEHDRLWFEQKPPRDFDFDE